MTETALDWVGRAETVKGELVAIERAATQSAIPPDVITQLRSAVDHCRTTLWAVVTASGQEGREAAILAARLARIEEMCARVVDEIAAGRVWVGTPGLGRVVAALDETERRVKLLLKQSASVETDGLR